MKNILTLAVEINAPIEEVWAYFTQPQHVVNWNHPSKDWHCTKAQNNLQVVEKFSNPMASMVGSFGFDLEAVYKEVVFQQWLAFTFADERKVTIEFIKVGNQTKIIENFEAENETSLEVQLKSRRLIFDNFKSYVESSGCWI